MNGKLADTMFALMLLNVFDTIASIVLIGLNYTNEANPLLAAVASNLPVLATLKLALSGLGFGVAFYVRRHRGRISRGLSWLANLAVLIYSAVVGAEVALIASVALAALMGV